MPDEPSKILIVDDDEDITVTICEYFKSQDFGVQPIATSDPRKVLTLLKENPDIRLILSDFRMPGINGFELLMMVKAEFPKVLFVIMTGYSTQELKREGFRRGAIRYIEKPFDLGELADIIRDALQGSSAGFGGHIEAIQLPDIIQLIGLSRRTVTLNITADQGKAAIYFQDGEVIHAVCGDLTGEDAFYEIFKWTGGRFTFHPSVDGASQSITQSWQGLLIEAARREDEAHIPGAEGPVVAPNGDGKAADISALANEPETEKEAVAVEAEPPKVLSKAVPEAGAKVKTKAAKIEGGVFSVLDEEPKVVTPQEEKPAPRAKPVLKAAAGVGAWEAPDLADEELLAAVTAASEVMHAGFEEGADRIVFGKNQLEALPDNVKQHFFYDFHQILKTILNTENAPFNFDQPDLASALDDLFQALLRNWEIERSAYQETLNRALSFETCYALDPVKAIVDFADATTDMSNVDIQDALQTMMEHSLIEEHYKDLIADLKKQKTRKVPQRQLEYLGRAILYRRSEDEGFASAKGGLKRLMDTCAHTGSKVESVSAGTWLGMLEAHGVVQLADYFRGELKSEDDRLSLDDLDAVMIRYRKASSGK